MLKSFVKHVSSFPRQWSRLANHRALSICIVAVIPLIGRLLLLPIIPIPIPGPHTEEFGYLLGANTFAMGRMTNPTPPMWVHFEAIHQFMKPTYMSIYPVGYSVLLALGKVLFGHYWWAVWLSVGVMCGLLTWMLQGWLPPAWALMGGVLAALQFGLTHYWMNSYMGGSLTAIGGCLVLGALPRLKKNLRPSLALAVAFGLMILANTRQFEGLVMSVGVAAALAPWLFQQNGTFLRRFLFRAVLPSLAVIIPIGCLTLAENKAIIGHAFKSPYMTYREEYGFVPIFVWQQPREPPVYNHEKLRRNFVELEPQFEKGMEWGTLRGLLPGIKARFEYVGSTFFPHVLYLPLALASFAAAFSKRIRWLGLIVGTALAGSMLSRFLLGHYLAPIFGALMAIHLQFLRYVRAWRWNGRRIGRGVYSGILCLLLVLFAFRTYTRSVEPELPWASNREAIRQRLESAPGKHLLFVRYNDDYPPSHDWVYNEPDIPAAKLIWARSMTPELDRELERYFSDRSAWEVNMDEDPPVLRRR